MISTTFLILRSSFMMKPSFRTGVARSGHDLVPAFTIRIPGPFSVSRETLFIFSRFFPPPDSGAANAGRKAAQRINLPVFIFFLRENKNRPSGGKEGRAKRRPPRKKPPKGGYFLHIPKKQPPIPRLPAPRRGPRRPRRTTTARHPRLSCRPSPVCTPLPPGAPPRWTFFLFGHTTVRRTGTVSGSAGRLTAPLIFLKETQ